jgi:hypothetical protein
MFNPGPRISNDPVQINYWVSSAWYEQLRLNLFDRAKLFKEMPGNPGVSPGEAGVIYDETVLPVRMCIETFPRVIYEEIDNG